MDVSNLPDEELVHYVKTVEHHAYRELVERYEVSIMRYITSIIGDETKAHELAQMTFLRAFEDLASFHTSEKFGNWIHKYAHLMVVWSLKKEGKVKVGEGETFEEDLSEMTLEGSQEPEVVSNLASKSRHLSFLYQDPIVLHYVCGRSIQDVAEILQLPYRVVEGRIVKGMQKLKEIQ